VFHNVVYDNGLIWKSPARTSSIHHTENWYLLRCSRTSFATRNFHHPVDLQELEVGQPTSRVRSIHIQIIGLENCVVLTLEELCSSNDVHHVLIHWDFKFLPATPPGDTGVPHVDSELYPPYGEWLSPAVFQSPCSRRERLRPCSHHDSSEDKTSSWLRLGTWTWRSTITVWLSRLGSQVQLQVVGRTVNSLSIS
jgi:hypothetical protein